MMHIYIMGYPVNAGGIWDGDMFACRGSTVTRLSTLDLSVGDSTARQQAVP